MTELPGRRPTALLLDLLMATMDSMRVWAEAADDRSNGLAWRDAVTRRMLQAGRYVPYDELVTAAARELGLPADATQRLWSAWERIEPWPDAAVLQRVDRPYAFVTNSSKDLKTVAVHRSGLHPAFALSAEEAGWYKPRPEIYRTACAGLGTDPERTLFVAGAAYDAQGAADAGLQAVLVERRPLDTPLSPTIAVVRSLEDAIAER